MHPLPFGTGLVEGFYGRQWSDADRLACLDLLAGNGFRYYLYAPKGDAVLRRRWSERWTADDERRVRAIAGRCERTGLLWGVGLSPLGLVEDPTAAALARWRDKLRYLQDFGAQLLCILFDDMPRRIDALAGRQAELVALALEASGARHALVCPSYYSTDPVLERVFGPMPAGYWEDLGRLLPREVGIFWTGERVCAESQCPDALRAIATRLGRAPVLWDNYPVNDGAKGSKFLRIDAFRGRSAGLADVVTAHFVNPMNQCWLSRIPLRSLAMLYRQGAGYDPDTAFLAAVRAECGEPLALQFAQDLDVLAHQGLDAIDAPQRAELARCYARHDAPQAREVRAWLAGEYAFDPACLTD